MAHARLRDTFTFHLSCDVDLPFQVRILSCNGVLPTDSQRPSAFYVRVALSDDGEVIGLEERTRYYDRLEDKCDINENLTFCVKFRDLPENAQLGFTVGIKSVIVDCVISVI